MTTRSPPRAENASRRLDWVAPNVQKLTAGSAEEEGRIQTDLIDAKS
jgi:hypothetical protein